jgi:hypothetical protein
VDLDQIGVDPGQRASAGRADAAAAERAEEGGGEPPDEALLAHPRWSDQQVGVDRAPGCGPELVDGGGLAHDLIEKGADRQFSVSRQLGVRQ